MLSIAYHPIYQLPLPAGHRFPMEKYDLLPKQLLHEGSCTAQDFFEPKPIDEKSIQRVHCPHYLKRLIKLELERKEIRKIGFPLSQQLIDREITIAGGTVEGAKRALTTGIAMNIAGGTHHAFSNRGEAFCLLNDQAIAAQYLLDHQLAKSILIVDLDVHQGNGTAEIFKDNPNVFTFSMHGAKNYPFQKEKSDLDLALADGMQDEAYLKLLKNTLPQLLDRVAPDFVFYLCGVDVVATDKLGRLGMSIEGCKERDKYVLETLKTKEIPVQCSMGGGYSKDIKIILEAHANTFRIAQDLYN
ncbi:MAG: histone deacetylase [Flavobacteriaceae bacterium]